MAPKAWDLLKAWFSAFVNWIWHSKGGWWILIVFWVIIIRVIVIRTICIWVRGRPWLTVDSGFVCISWNNSFSLAVKGLDILWKAAFFEVSNYSPYICRIRLCKVCYSLLHAQFWTGLEVASRGIIFRQSTPSPSDWTVDLNSITEGWLLHKTKTLIIDQVRRFIIFLCLNTTFSTAEFSRFNRCFTQPWPLVNLTKPHIGREASHITAWLVEQQVFDMRFGVQVSWVLTPFALRPIVQRL